jgi:hypothetical protein
MVIIAGIGITHATSGATAVSLYQMRLDAMAQARDAAQNLVLSLQKETERRAISLNTSSPAECNGNGGGRARRENRDLA